VVHRRESRSDGREGTGDWEKRNDRAGGRRPSTLHDARQRPHGESGRVVGSALDSGPHSAQAEAVKLVKRWLAPFPERCQPPFCDIFLYKSMHVNKLRVFFTGALIVVATACGGQNEEGPGAPPPNAKRVDQSKTGNVAGRVTVEGVVPANPPLQIEGDPYCSQQNPNGARAENFVV